MSRNDKKKLLFWTKVAAKDLSNRDKQRERKYSTKIIQNIYYESRKFWKKICFYWLLESIEEADYGWNSWDIKLREKKRIWNMIMVEIIECKI